MVLSCRYTRHLWYVKKFTTKLGVAIFVKNIFHSRRSRNHKYKLQKTAKTILFFVLNFTEFSLYLCYTFLIIKFNRKCRETLSTRIGQQKSFLLSQ